MPFSKSLYLFFAVFFSITSLFSQQESRDYDIIWHSADDNSLPQNSVKSIIKDKYGFLWLSTENGLVRYDGNKFKVFNIENLKGLRTNRISYFKGTTFTDSIYVFSDFSDLILIKKNKPSVISENKIPESFRLTNHLHKGKRVSVPKIHKKDNSYFSLKNGTVVAYTKNNSQLWKVDYDSDDTTVFFLVDDVLYSYKNGKFVRFVNGKIYFASIEGLPTKGFTIFPNTVSQQTFIAFDNTVYLLERHQEKLKLRVLLKNFDIAKNNIISYYYDSQNDILYMGSSTNGLLIVKKKKFNSIIGNNKNGVYYAQIPHGTDSFLTTSGEIFSNEGVQEKRVFIKDNDNYILLKDRNGDLWTKEENKIYRLNKSTNFTTSDTWSFEDRVILIFETRAGEILAGTAMTGAPDGKLYQLKHSEPSKKPSFKLSMMLPFNPTYMLEIEDNILWTGSHLGFHKIYYKEKKIENIRQISNTYVRSIYIENPAEIWVTTYEKGFFLYNQFTKKTTHFPIDRNRYLLSSHCIIEDQNGYLWVSTNKGLFQASKKNLLNYSQGKTDNVYYQYYDKSDGFYTNEFNGGCQPCGLKLGNNALSFPSMRGNILFFPENIKLLLPDNEIYFQEAEVDNRTQEINNDTLLLNNDFGRVRLFINSPYYGNPNNLNIEIRLQGPISQKWTPLKGDEISYTSLPHGTYYLTARKLTGFDSGYKYKTLIIIVPPAFYQTIWFTILMLLCGITFIFYTIKMRIRYIRRKNVLLEKKIAEQTFQLRHTISTLRNTKEKLSEEIINHKKLIRTITHDIKSPLRFLALTGKHAYQNSNNKETVEEDLKSIYTSSFQLYHFVDNLLEYTKVSKQENSSEPYSLYRLAEEKIQIFLNIASSQKTEIVNKIDPAILLSTNKLLLSIIIHNLLDNAIKNTFNGRIVFTSAKKEDTIFIRIKDTGKGMSAELLDFYNNPKNAKTQENIKKTGMGLPMIAELLIILNGNMYIESELLQGTEITISLQEEKNS
ncbi:signal transduction histidine kinase [Flavobacterium sp. 28YEA47A]|uniref:ligand-binding sensor domain-containing protein n=1 Tax=Flavobacterium sp. 28YEA47A TaxID=3156276 RepID=UPI0035177964